MQNRCCENGESLRSWIACDWLRKVRKDGLQMIEYKTGNQIVKYVPDYVVFDLETTGTSYLNDSIIEISAVKAEKGKITDTFSALVNPQRQIPYYATQVNGITDEMVEDASVLLDVLPEFLDFIGDSVLIGHNIHSFDLRFIYKAAQELLERDVPNDYIDTLYMARQCLPQLAHHKLTDLAAYFQINTDGAHRALQDCRINQQCYEKLAELQKEVVLELCPRCGGELRRRNGKFGAFFGCSNYPRCRYTRNI